MLFVVFVSGVVVVTITTLTFVPVALTVALTVIAIDAPGARLVIVQSRAWAVVVHEPALVVADTNETFAGAARPPSRSPLHRGRCSSRRGCR